MEFILVRARIAGGWVATGIVAAVFAFVAAPTAYAGESDKVSGWAWGAEVGWISMNSTNCEGLNRAGEPDPCALGGTDYGVTIARNGAMTGYAWSRSAGWICIGATCGVLGPEWGSATPTGGWRARVNAITGEVTGWAKAVALKDGGWISFSCENTASCGSAAYRTTVNVATGMFAGHAWSSSSDGHGLGWIAWAPAFGGVTTTWRPEPLCSESGDPCSSDVECRLPGELCCLGGTDCGRCDGAGAQCGINNDCGDGVLCCREGQQCGQCSQNGEACGSDRDCQLPDGLAAGPDSCCPPGALCTRTGPAGSGGGCDNNGSCGAGENATNCPLDCGSSEVRGSTCDGDGDCEAGEAVSNCASDCGAGGGGGTCNNNGVCDAGESVADCASDCGGVTQTPIVGVCDISTPTLCVDEAQCGGNACRVADVGICAASGDTIVCGGLAQCDQSGGACETDFGIRVDPEFLRRPSSDDLLGRDGQSVPCTTDDVNCRKVIGKCTITEQLCAVDENCPNGERCGKLFLPWVQTRLGSIYSGGSVGSSRTAPPPSGQYNATYCILAGGPIVNFLSEQGCGSDRERIQQTPYPRAGRLSLPKFPNYVGSIARIDVSGILSGRYGTSIQTLPALTQPGGLALGGRVYQPTSNDTNVRIGETDKTITLNNGGGNTSGAGLFVVRGKDLLIESDIVYGSGAVTNVRNLASPGFLVLKDRVRDASGAFVEVGGNIIIHPSVTALVGAFYAEGEIKTGSIGSAARDLPLVVNGVMVARKFIFERLHAGAQASEQITADGRVVANPPPGFGDLARSLPTITQTAP